MQNTFIDSLFCWSRTAVSRLWLCEKRLYSKSWKSLTLIFFQQLNVCTSILSLKLV